MDTRLELEVQFRAGARMNTPRLTLDAWYWKNGNIVAMATAFRHAEKVPDCITLTKDPTSWATSTELGREMLAEVVTGLKQRLDSMLKAELPSGEELDHLASGVSRAE